ncbi:hypothetical protein PIB30_059599 [Stylosanthes scabra]|uniref:Uncharacterized protein n=1 Tax=Stylosanthes scabra TaxID=79078 RepID=A0ABU6WIL4_9FABA|nr:hypothetical protein [Stylosanthes scabra]
MATPSRTVTEAAFVEHIKSLIEAARASSAPERRLSPADHEAAATWIAQHPDDVAAVIHAATRWEHCLEFVSLRDWSTVATYRCRQTTLRQLCGELRRPVAAYQKQTHRSNSRGIVHREDAAAAMIRTLLDATGEHIDDYNYDQIDPTLQEISELRWEVGTLSSANRKLKGNFKDLKRAFILDYVPSSSDSD